MVDKLNVIVICGSLRKGSFNASVARALPALAPPEMTIKPAPGYDKFPLYNADMQAAGNPPEVIAWVEAIRATDGVVIVSAEYNWSIPGPLKNAIDWASRVKDQPFKDKPVALQSASPGLVGGSRMQYHLRQALTSIDAMMFGKPEVIINFANKKIDEKTGEIADQPTKDIITQQLAAFAKFIERVRA
ncbi:MAG: NADPH-dependent FMN reductase [Hyphomicrobiales bacterium]